MEKEFATLVEAVKKFNGVTIIDTSLESTWIHFRCNVEASVASITQAVNELKEQHNVNMLTLNDLEDHEKFTYQLLLEGDNKPVAATVLAKKLISIAEIGSKKTRAKELGIPDLSLVTIRQMAVELKQRQNLVFALVWMEDNERDNIAIEGSGNPTQLVGLLARGMHMAVEWADKNIKFYKPKDEAE